MQSIKNSNISEAMNDFYTNANCIKQNSIMLYSLLIVLSPVFQNYTSPIPMITLSEFGLILFFLYVFVKKECVLFLSYEFLPFILYLLFSIVKAVFMVENNYLFDAVGTALRLVFNYFFLMCFTKSFFDYKTATNYLFNSAALLSFYGILQKTMSLFGIHLLNYIPFLPTNSLESIYLRDLEKYEYYGMAYRCCSLFPEPSHLGIYLSLAFVLILFSKEKFKYKKIYVSLFLAGMLICKSSTSIIIAIVSVFYFIFFYYRDKISIKSIIVKYFMFFLSLFLLGIVFYCSDIFNYFMSKTFNGQISLYSLTHLSRFNGIYEIINYIDVYDCVFGYGMQQTRYYLPGFARIIYCLGFVCFIIVLFQFVNLYKKCDYEQKTVIITFFILNIGTEIILGSFAILYYSFIVANKSHFNVKERDDFYLNKNSNYCFKRSNDKLLPNEVNNNFAIEQLSLEILKG